MSDSVDHVSELLGQTTIEVAPAMYVIIGLSHQVWSQLIENPELSPRADAPFLIFRDQHEVTLVIEEDDWARIRHAARDAKTERGFRLVTLDISLPWNTVGFLARVTALLATEGISIGAITAFSRDHLLIKQDDLGKALRVLGEQVAEAC